MSLISELKDLYSKANSLGDELKNISTSDIEMKSLVVDLSSSAYALALDIQDAAETYAEIQNEEAEDLDENVETESVNNNGLKSERKIELEDVNPDEPEYRLLASKTILDSDGFCTDYSLYELINADDFPDKYKYLCIFGDKDIYEPDEDFSDYETYDREDAWDWYNEYNGFDEDGNIDW